MGRVPGVTARHPAAGIGLVLVAVWVGVVAVECFTAFPWDAGGSYQRAVETAALAWHGVAGVAAFVWLFERASA